MAMLVVMFLLLIVTATATFAVHATATELRSSGYSRQRMQTRYVAEAALTSTMIRYEQSGCEPFELAIRNSEGGSTARVLAPEEPQMSANRANVRVDPSEFVGSVGIVGQPIETTAGRESMGYGLAIAPNYAVDINDSQIYPAIVAGERSDSFGSVHYHYRMSVYTSRGYTRPTDTDAYSPTQNGAATTLRRGFHESVVNARAIGRVGPCRDN